MIAAAIGNGGRPAYWAVAQLQPQRERLALNLLARADFQVYAPRLREWRAMPSGGPLRQRELPLFPGYTFLLIRLQWLAARWCPGVIRLVMDGLHPARVPDSVIEEIRARERNGVIELPRRQLKPGDRVRILAGPFRGHFAIYDGMSGLERVTVLLQILGSATRVTLARKDGERWLRAHLDRERDPTDAVILDAARQVVRRHHRGAGNARRRARRRAERDARGNSRSEN